MTFSDPPQSGAGLLRALILGGLLPVFAAGEALALQDTPPSRTATAGRHAFDIPAGSLASALTRFSVATGNQILFETRLVSESRTAALQGEFSSDEALGRLLEGSGLTYERVDARTYVIARPVMAAPADRPVIAGRTGRAGSPDSAAAQEGSGAPAAAFLDPQEVIVVTGSRLERSGRSSVVPVQLVGRAALESSGAVEIGEMLAGQSPATLEFSSASTHLSAQNAGLTSIGLRGLGTTRTLVLIDGRRTVSNSGNASRFGSDTIPAEFVERVEISTGGASALYGSDAVAGVVNFVLRDDLEGGRLMLQVGVTQDGGGSYEALSATQGGRFAGGRGRVLFNLTQDSTARIGAEDRDWARSPVALSADGERLELDLSSYPLGGRFIGYDFWFDETGLQTDFDTASDGYDTRSLATISVPRERTLLALKTDFELDSQLSAHFTGLFSHSDSLSAREPQTAYYNERFGLENEQIGAIPVDHPFVPAEIRDAALARGLSGISWRRRFGELGEEYRQIDRTTHRLWAGLAGQTEAWSWDLTFGHGRYDQDQLRSGELNYAHIQAALQIEPDPVRPGSYRCRDADARADGCVPLDIFGIGAVSQEAADYIRATERLSVEIDQWTLGFTAVGELALPGGRALPLAWGLEYRVDRQWTDGDEAAQRRETGYVAVPDLDASAHAGEVFAETRLPLVEGRPGIDRLELAAAVRFANYDIDRVGLVGSYRLGLSWAVNEAFSLRGQVSRAQRAPGLTELYSGPRGDYDSVIDPCHGVTAAASGTLAENCRAEPGIAQAIAQDGIYEQRVTSIYAPNSGNPDLREERSDAVTLGAVFTPPALDGFSLSVDLYDIRVSGAISSLGSQLLLTECYGASLPIEQNAYCATIDRAANGQLRQMENRLANLDEIRSAGLDVMLDYRWQIDQSSPLAGEWDAHLLYAHTDTLEQVFERSDGAIRRSVWVGEAGAPRLRWTARLGWQRDRWRLQWRIRYEGAAVDGHSRAAAANAADMLFVHIDPWMQHDLYAQYTPDRDGRLRLFAGINNLFHDYGPFLPSGTESGDRRNFTPGYDVEGRRFFAGIRTRW